MQQALIALLFNSDLSLSAGSIGPGKVPASEAFPVIVRSCGAAGRGRSGAGTHLEKDVRTRKG